MHEKRTPDVIQGFVLFYHHDKLSLYFNIYIYNIHLHSFALQPHNIPGNI